MTIPATIAESWEAWEADRPVTAATPAARVQDRRTWYAAAQATALLIRAGRTPEQILSEVAQFGRTVGRPEERAA